MARVLVTGGSGKLGRLCVADLLDHGHTPAIFDRLGPEKSQVPWESNCPTYLGEAYDAAAVETAFREFAPEVVFHIAANPGASDHPGHQSGTRSVARDDTFCSNVLGTYYILDAAVRHRVNRLVAASSFFVLGIGFRISEAPFVVERLPIDESHPNRPEDSYSLSKLLNEEMYAAYARAYGLQTVALRLLGVHYPGISTPRFHDSPRPPEDPDRFDNVWMYVDGRDAAQAFRLAMEARELEPFEAFYIATGRTIAGSPRYWLKRYYPTLANKAASLSDEDDIISIAKARRLLGYNPQHFWLDEKAAHTNEVNPH